MIGNPPHCKERETKHGRMTMLCHSRETIALEYAPENRTRAASRGVRARPAFSAREGISRRPETPKLNVAKFFLCAAPAFFGLAVGTIASAARAQVNIAPQALQHYAYCIEQSQQNNFVFPGDYVAPLERGVMYRCRDEVAVAYYNDLGRRRRRSEDRFVSNETGAYVLRPITGVGYCWHKVENELHLPVSYWGCDLFVAY
jgi:hypothetical protein